MTDKLTAVLQCFFDCHLQSTAARNFHTHNSDTFNIVLGNNLGEFFTVINAIQLWAANERHLALDKFLMEVCV